MYKAFFSHPSQLNPAANLVHNTFVAKVHFSHSFLSLRSLQASCSLTSWALKCKVLWQRPIPPIGLKPDGEDTSEEERAKLIKEVMLITTSHRL